MNKVFKVIWSEARNAYVVVSEIAKNHGSKSCSTKKLLAMLIATGVMTCASVAPVMAANLAPDDYQIEAGNGASASGQGSVAIGNKAQASGLVGIAIGRDAVARGDDSIAIGSQTQAGETYSVAVGNDIGYTAYAGTAVGQQAYASGSDSTAIGTMTNVDDDYNRTHDDWRKAGKQSTAIGAYAGSWGEASASVGAFSKAEGEFATALGYAGKANGYCSTALGDFAEANVNYGVALGGSSVADRRGGAVGAFAPEGADSLTWKANRGAVSVGSKTITRQITNVAAGSEATDAVNVAQLRAVTENAGWNLSTGKEITNPTKVKSGATVDFSGDGENITVSKEETDYATLVNVKLNKNLNVDSVQAGDFFMNNKKGIGFGGNAYITKDGLNANDKVITNVAKGKYNTDAVNVGQLKKVEEVAANANKGWNLSTNGVATEATNVAPGEYVDFSGDKNISVSNDKTKVKVELNKDLVDIESISNGDAKLTLGGFTTELTNGQGASVKLFGDTTTINNAVTVYKDGRIAGVAAGINDNDAVNVGQLKAVGATANMGWNLATNGVATEATNVKPGDFVDFSGDKNISVSHDGTKVKVELNKDIDVNSVQTNALNSKYNLSVGTMAENGIMPFFVNSTGDFYAAHNKFSVDKDGKVTATAGEIGNVVLNNGVFYKNSALRDGELFIGDADGNYSQITTKGAKLGKVTVAEDGKITGVAAGAITADSTDAVNGSQLHAVATEAGKHSKVVNGSNINVEEFDNDGQKIYKVNLNKDIMLGDLTGKYVNISGTNGTIEATGAIATKDRVYADKGAKLADIDVTGNKISNGASSIVLDGSNVKVNDKVTIDQNGKISGVAAGEVSKTSTDAINGSQLNQTNENVAALDKRVTQNEADIAQNKADIAQNKADIAQNKTDIKNLDNRVTNVEELAKKHTTVTAGDNIAVTESTNKDGGKEYNVALDKDINLDSVTTGQTSISNDGLKVNGKTYVSDSGLNANDQKITNVADGKVEKGSTDAVNGGQLYNETRVAKDGNFVKKSNTAGENLSALDNQVTANTESIYHMNGRISDLDNRVNKVGAGAAALAALHPLDFDPDAKWDFAAGYGNYRGANAAAVGAYYRPNEDTMFSVGGSFGNGENMVNAGVSFKLGSGSSHVSTSRVAMAKEIKELRGELEAMKSAMLDANAGKKIDTSKLQLFPDVPQNHWAYEYVAQLAGNGMIEGYPDGNFAGDRPMTRYEYAAILYRAMTKGAVLSDKILSEFSHELEYFTVDTIAKDKAGNPTIQRVRTVKENKNK